jgi:hypothetical protein
MSRFSKESDLLPVTAAPGAKKEMKPQSQALPPSQSSIHLPGLQSGGLFARESEIARPRRELLNQSLHDHSKKLAAIPA